MARSKSDPKPIDPLVWQRKIRRTNAVFKAATKAEKRVMIAKDVIAAVEAKRVTAVSGYYLSHPEVDAGIGGRWQEHPPKDGQVCIPTSCGVCAKGAMFVAKIDRLNHLKWAELAETTGDDDPSRHLTELFDQEQLNMIESAFERSDFCFRMLGESDHEHNLRERRSIQFGAKYDNPSDRLIAIMENIVAHKGKFVPGKGGK